MISFLDIHKINFRFHDEFQSEFDAILNTSRFILGNKLKQFEDDYAKYCETKYCIGTGNGLDALTLILKGYIATGRLREGDKVIVPSTTFIATILSVIYAGLEPVFIDANRNTFNMSIEEIKTHFSKDVKAIIAVHLYGQLADMNAINTFCKTHNILCIEDAAQAHGAINESNVKAGNLGDAAAFSFYPSKNLGALGDGGAITTNDEGLYNILLKLRNYGSDKKYHHKIIGYNSRLDEMQASFLSVKLKYLDADNEKRRLIAKRYLSEVENAKIKLPYYNGSKDHVFYAFVIQVDDREMFIEYLNKHNIGNLIHYPIPPHQQEALKKYNGLSLPITEQIHKTVVSLPISPVMIDDDVTKVIKILNAY